MKTAEQWMAELAIRALMAQAEYSMSELMEVILREALAERDAKIAKLEEALDRSNAD